MSDLQLSDTFDEGSESSHYKTEGFYSVKNMNS